MNEMITELIADHWAKVLGTIAAIAAGSLWGRWRMRRQWKKRQFMHRLMVSLNTVSPIGGRGTLQIRTLLEKNLNEVMLNADAAERLMKLAAKTTEASSIIPIPEKDRWYYLNAVLNEVAENFNAGTLAKDMGLPVKTETYLICLTNEKDGDIRTHKIRAMVVSADKLLRGCFRGIELERSYHQKRLDTLEEMRAAYLEDQSNFLEVEISLPSSQRAKKVPASYARVHKGEPA